MEKARLLLKYLRPYRWTAIKNILYNMLGAIFALLSFTLIIPFINLLFDKVDVVPSPGAFTFSVNYFETFFKYYISDFIAREGQMKALLLVSLFFVAASFLKNGFIILANNSMTYMRAGIVRDMRRMLYHKILRLPISYFTNSRKGDIMTRISNDVQEIELSIISSLTMLFRDPITILIFVIYLFLSSFTLSIIALILLPISGWLIGRTSRTLRSSSFAGQQKLGRLLSIVDETLTGLRIIKGFNAEDRMKQQFAEMNEQYAKVFKRVTRKYYLATPVSEFLGTIVIIILVYTGGMLALQGKGGMTSGDLLAFVVVFSQILQPAKNISTAWFSIQKGMASMDRIDQVLEADESISEKTDALPVYGFSDSIEFQNVWYGYSDEPVLKDINLKIKKGQTIAIVGKSGAGKSTLADLLPRLIDVGQGKILIDGNDIRDLKIRDLRHLMGIVSQRPILFNTTFRENIAFGVINADPGAVENAARIANAHDFIVETEKGYESMVGESGNKLSGGQLQRISIARAIMANPQILILDEATSALDTESERLVQDAILKLMENRTSLVIAHRLSTIQHADLIVVIDEGRIVETGTHEELINRKDGFYQRLHSFQAI